MMSEEQIQQVIEVLQASRQTLVFLDSLICPVRSVVPSSERDQVMRWLIEELKDRDIIEYALGFASLAKRPAYFYATSFTLTDGFFAEHCSPRRPRFTPCQLSLFGEGAA